MNATPTHVKALLLGLGLLAGVSVLLHILAFQAIKADVDAEQAHQSALVATVLRRQLDGIVAQAQMLSQNPYLHRALADPDERVNLRILIGGMYPLKRYARCVVLLSAGGMPLVSTEVDATLPSTTEVLHRRALSERRAVVGHVDGDLMFVFPVYPALHKSPDASMVVALSLDRIPPRLAEDSAFGALMLYVTDDPFAAPPAKPGEVYYRVPVPFQDVDRPSYQEKPDDARTFALWARFTVQPKNRSPSSWVLPFIAVDAAMVAFIALLGFFSLRRIRAL